MYIERDIRKATPGREQQSGNEYLSKCLTLFIRHTVHELPAILGKSITIHPKKREKGTQRIHPRWNRVKWAKQRRGNKIEHPI